MAKGVVLKMKPKWWVGLSTVGVIAIGFIATHPALKPAAAASATGVSAANGLPTITVIGRSSEQIAPGLAVIDAGVSTNATDAQSAQQQNDSAMLKLQSALESAGVKATNIRTLWYNIHPNYQQVKAGSPTVSGFNAVDDIQVQVTDLKQVGDIVDLLVKNGANQINNVSYQVADPLKIQEQAYNAALADAKAQANNIAQALGVTISGVQSVDTTNGGGAPGPIYAASDSASSAAPMAPGTQDVTTTVKVVYTLASTTGN